MENAPGNSHASTDRRASILVADDEEKFREFLQDVLSKQGYEVRVYDPLRPSPEHLETPCDVAIVDIIMPGTDGFALRETISKHSPSTQFIMMTGYPDQEKLEKALDRGVFTFLTKPFTGDHILYAVLGALRMKRLLHADYDHDALLQSENLGLVGASRAMAEVRRRILQLAPLDIPVLITGESGTGKEIVSRCIHQYSRRVSGPFTAINCAGLSPSLIESELFGHARGAFTGATRTKHGFFEISDRGTLFLDEIGDLPLELQSRLLRVLDSGEFVRVGETEVRRVDVRVISATNRALEDMVNKGGFRPDLFYRLRGRQVHLAPLRERREDIPLLARHFLGDDAFAVAPEAMKALQSFDWPGNVRELVMVVENLKAISPGKVVTGEAVRSVIRRHDSPEPGCDDEMSYSLFKEQVIKPSEKAYFESLLTAVDGNVARAAKRAGMHRKNFYEKLKQHGLKS